MSGFEVDKCSGKELCRVRKTSLDVSGNWNNTTAEENPAVSGQEDFAPVEEKKEATKENNENKESTKDEPLKQSSEDDLDKFESENNEAEEDSYEKEPGEESKDGELKQEDPTG
eukprot:gene11114-12284_t